jgi:hypothetical protein
MKMINSFELDHPDIRKSSFSGISVLITGNLLPVPHGSGIE